MHLQYNVDTLYRPTQADCKYVRRRQHRMFGSINGFCMQEEEGGETCYTDEEGKDDVNSVHQHSTFTDSDSHGDREVECGQFCSRHSTSDGYQTEGGHAISHFSVDSFDIAMAPRTFCDIDKPEEMDDYEPGTRRETGGMQYGGYSYEGENQGHVARGSPIYEHLLRRVVDRLCDIDFRGNDRYISDVIVPRGPNGVDEVAKELQTMLRQFPPKLPVIVTAHGDHVHCVHVCRQSNSACRCIWLQRSVLYRQHGRRRLRRRVWAIRLTSSDWESIVRYFSTDGREPQQIDGVGSYGGLRDGRNFIQVCGKKLFAICS